MANSKNDNSIENTLKVIRKAIQENSEKKLDPENKILILDQLVKEDGTIENISDSKPNNSEIENIFDKNFDKWMDKNLPYYIEKYLKKNNNS
mgnify:CR=1 FL=1